MAKVKFTDKGNVNVTMNADQFSAIMSILNLVDNSCDGHYAVELIDFMEDMQDFMLDNGHLVTNGLPVTISDTEELHIHDEETWGSDD